MGIYGRSYKLAVLFLNVNLLIQFSAFFVVSLFFFAVFLLYFGMKKVSGSVKIMIIHQNLIGNHSSESHRKCLK